MVDALDLETIKSNAVILTPRFVKKSRFFLRPIHSGQQKPRHFPLSLDGDIANGPLTKILFDFNLQRGQTAAFWMLTQNIEKLLPHPAGDKFGRCVCDRQQNAIFPGKHPSAFLKRRGDFAVLHHDFDPRVRCRQQHSVIQLIDQLLRGISKSDEIEDVTVFIKWSGNLNGDSPIVSVQSLADVAVEGDEMSGAENQMVFRHSNSILFSTQSELLAVDVCFI